MMPVGTADLHTAIQTVWDASTLNTLFKALWNSAVTAANHVVLSEREAPGRQPFPYCVFESQAPRTISRMSGNAGEKQQIIEVMVVFNVFADKVDGDARSAKQIAAYLAEEVMKVFGGHPTQSPTGTLTLSNGTCLIVQYINDYPARTDELRYQWMLTYVFRLDVPMKV